jgi:hypothetical protein
MNELFDSLTKPFSSSEISFRVAREFGNNASVLAYITARGIMNRLDEVFGISNWRDEYEMVDKGVVCRLSVRIGDKWITKVDAAPFTNIESLKGGFSDALKRTGVKFGIGRYLYDLPEQWVDLLPDKPKDCKNYVHSHKNKSGKYVYWIDPILPAWALPDSNDVTDDDCESPDAVRFANKEALRKLEKQIYGQGILTMDNIAAINKYVLGVGDAKEAFDTDKIIQAINIMIEFQDEMPVGKLSVDSIDIFIEVRMLIEYPNDIARDAAIKKYPDKCLLLDHLREKRVKRLEKEAKKEATA